jgi:hypothetical protein
MSKQNFLAIASASILLLAASFIVGMFSDSQVSAQVPLECAKPIAGTSQCDRGSEGEPNGHSENGEVNGVENGEDQGEG